MRNNSSNTDNWHDKHREQWSVAASGYIRTIATETFKGRSGGENIGNEYMGEVENRNGSRNNLNK